MYFPVGNAVMCVEAGRESETQVAGVLLSHVETMLCVTSRRNLSTLALHEFNFRSFGLGYKVTCDYREALGTGRKKPESNAETSGEIIQVTAAVRPRT